MSFIKYIADEANYKEVLSLVEKAKEITQENEGDWFGDERLAYQKLIKSCHFQDFFHLGLDVE